MSDGMMFVAASTLIGACVGAAVCGLASYAHVAAVHYERKRAATELTIAANSEFQRGWTQGMIERLDRRTAPKENVAGYGDAPP